MSFYSFVFLLCFFPKPIPFVLFAPQQNLQWLVLEITSCMKQTPHGLVHVYTEACKGGYCSICNANLLNML